nr:killer cell immunoglobulin-like receptor 2DS3 [Misgurnus anguillicaudatus]
MRFLKPHFLLSSALSRATVRVTPDRSVFTGETVTLKCEIEDQYSNFTYRWSNSRTSVFNSEHYTVKRDTLTINRVTESDQDAYWCIVNRDGRPSLSSSSVNLTVKALPRATVIVTPDRSVFTGETVTLKCEIEDQYRSLNWRYGWSNRHTSVFNSERYIVNRDSLTINGVNESDQNEYWCIGEIHGRPQTSLSSSAINLIVKGSKPKPNIISETEESVLTASGSSFLGLTVGLCLGLSFMFLIFFLVLLWCYKNKKLSQSPSAFSPQQNISQTSDQKQTGNVRKAADHTYANIKLKSKKEMKKKKKDDKDTSADNESEAADHIYANIELKPKKEMKKKKKDKKGNASKGGDNVYSNLKKGGGQGVAFGSVDVAYS